MDPKHLKEMNTEKKTISEEIQGTLTEIIEQIKKLIQEGNARNVTVRSGKGKILFQSQLTLGAAGATFFVFYAPILTAIATILMIASDVVVVVERFENEEDLNDEYEVDADVIEIRDEEDHDENKDPSNQDGSGEKSSADGDK